MGSVEAEVAYREWRRRYNVSVRSAYWRLGHVGVRVERVPCVGVELGLLRQGELDAEFGGSGRVASWLFMVGSSYCRMFGCRDFAAGYMDWDEGKAERYVEWLTSHGAYAAGVWRVCGRREGTGRSNRRYVKAKINKKVKGNGRENKKGRKGI